MTTICEYITESEVKASQYIELGASIASFIGGVATMVIASFYFRLIDDKWVGAPEPIKNRPRELVESEPGSLVLQKKQPTRQTQTSQPPLLRMIFWLAFSNAGNALSMLISTAVTLAGGKESFASCVSFRVLVQFFSISTFCWTSFFALSVRRELMAADFSATESQIQKRNFFYHMISWGIPFITVVILAAEPSYLQVTSDGWCTTKQVYQVVFWFAPLLVSVTLNLVLYFLIMKHIHSFRSFSTESQYLSSLQGRLSLYLICFALCWIWDLINHIFAFTNTCSPIWLRYMQYAFTPLQGIGLFEFCGDRLGLLNFLIFVGSQMFSRKTNLVDVREPLLSSGSRSGNRSPPPRTSSMIQILRTQIADYYEGRSLGRSLPKTSEQVPIEDE